MIKAQYVLVDLGVFKCHAGENNLAGQLKRQLATDGDVLYPDLHLFLKAVGILEVQHQSLADASAVCKPLGAVLLSDPDRVDLQAGVD